MQMLKASVAEFLRVICHEFYFLGDIAEVAEVVFVLHNYLLWPAGGTFSVSFFLENSDND